NAERRSAYEYWQFWRNTGDADVGRFLRLFTELPLDEIARLESLGDREINRAKEVLATAATTLCHGKAAAEAARGIPVFELLVRAGLAASNSEARRLVKGGGARVNDQPVASETQAVGLGDIGPQGTVKLS